MSDPTQIKPIEKAIQDGLYAVQAKRRLRGRIGSEVDGEVGQNSGETGDSGPVPKQRDVMSMILRPDFDENSLKLLLELLNNGLMLQKFLKRLQRSEYGVEMVRKLTSLLAKHASQGSARAQSVLTKMVDYAPALYKSAITSVLQRFKLSDIMNGKQNSPANLPTLRLVR